MSSSEIPSRDIISLTMPSNSSSAESSKTVPRGATLCSPSPSGTLITRETSETRVSGLPLVPVMQNISDPMRRAISAGRHVALATGRCVRRPSDLGFGDRDYFEAMDYNFTTLKEALQ